jgi:hypothetical protein
LTSYTTIHSWSSQTLTTLYLEHNEIGAQGAEHLANALQQNNVTFLTSFDFFYNYSLMIFTDTHNTVPRTQPNRWSRRQTSCECIATKQCNISHLIRLLLQLFIHDFHRHSQQCILDWTKSVLKVPNILRMHCNKTG